MKIRIASSFALAAGLVLGMSGCNLTAPQATLEQYAPSDGIELHIDGVDLLNVMLIADEGGENFNVVFNSVNLTGSPVNLSIQFENESGTRASADVRIPTGTTIFGDPELDQEVVVVSLPNTTVGSTVDAAFQIAGSAEDQRYVPVLDGTLVEYQPLVLPADFGSEPETGDATEETEDAAAEEVEADAAADGE